MSLTAHALPILFTLFFWWFSTGVILYLDGLPRRTFRWSLGGASVVMAAALSGLRATSADLSTSGAYCAFSCALLVWGWFEMAFLMGFVVGPRTTDCPQGSRGWRRAAHAFEAIAWHEFALVAGAALIAAFTWQAPNQLGLATFGLLWVARLSTKLNLFLGVRNLSEEFLPEHLRYLRTYFTRRAMNLLFPVSVTIGTVASVMLWQMAFDDALAAPRAAGLSFLATLATLALLEHWFLILPIKFAALWEWGLQSRRASLRVFSPKKKPGPVNDVRARSILRSRDAAAIVPAELPPAPAETLAACRR